MAIAIVTANPASAPAKSQQTLRVLLVVDRTNDPLMARIQAEIAAFGLTVVTSGATGPLETSAKEQHAIAVIRVLPSRKGVEIWMADVTTGRPLTRQLIVDERPAGPDYTLVAMQTAEVLRTGLFPKEAGPEPHPVPTTPAPPPQAPSQAEAVRAQAGIGGLYSKGGADPSLQAWLSLQRQGRHGLGVALALSGPILRGSLSGPEGKALVGATMAGVELFSSLLEDDSRWFLAGGLGGCIVNLRTKGQGTQPLLQGSSSTFTGVGYARAEFGLKLSPWASFAIVSSAGTSFVPVKIRFAGNQAGTWGSLLFASFLQFGVDW